MLIVTPFWHKTITVIAFIGTYIYVAFIISKLRHSDVTVYGPQKCVSKIYESDMTWHICVYHWRPQWHTDYYKEWKIVNLETRIEIMFPPLDFHAGMGGRLVGNIKFHFRLHSKTARSCSSTNVETEDKGKTSRTKKRLLFQNNSGSEAFGNCSNSLTKRSYYNIRTFALIIKGDNDRIIYTIFSLSVIELNRKSQVRMYYPILRRLR